MNNEFYKSPILLSGLATPSYNLMIRSCLTYYITHDERLENAD